MAPPSWWEDHDTGSKEAQVLTPAPSLFSSLPIYALHLIFLWALGTGAYLFAYFLSIGGKNRKYFCQTFAGPDSSRKQSFAASKVQSSKEFNWTSAFVSSRGLTGGDREN